MPSACYRKTVLDNGIRVVSERVPHGRSVSIGAWICSGSRDETPALNGISHLLEHMVFKGTQTRSAYEIAVSLEAGGGHLNAFTEKEFTCFYALILDSQVRKAVGILSDLIRFAVFRRKDLEHEKQVVGEEIRNLIDTPEDLVHEKFLQLIYKNHPLGRSILGGPASLRRIGLSDLREHYRSFFTADRIIIAASGRLDHEALVRLIRQHLGPVSPSKADVHLPVRLNRDREVRTRAPINQCHICTGTTGFPYNDRRKFALLLLNAWLGAGMSSRLFQQLREKKGLAYSVYSSLEFWRDTGLVTVYAGTSPDNEKKVLTIIDRELNRLAERGITAAEIRSLQNQLCGSLILSLEDVHSRMNRLAKMEAYTGGYTTLDEVLGRIRAVRPGELHDAAIELFGRRQRYLSVLTTGAGPLS
ncbi:insulinase family protein [bacterium]|nr:insulinase family protein [bacterium]